MRKSFKFGQYRPRGDAPLRYSFTRAAPLRGEFGGDAAEELDEAARNELRRQKAERSKGRGKNEEPGPW